MRTTGLIIAFLALSLFSPAWPDGARKKATTPRRKEGRKEGRQGRKKKDRQGRKEGAKDERRSRNKTDTEKKDPPKEKKRRRRSPSKKSRSTGQWSNSNHQHESGLGHEFHVEVQCRPAKDDGDPDVSQQQIFSFLATKTPRNAPSRCISTKAAGSESRRPGHVDKRSMSRPRKKCKVRVMNLPWSTTSRANVKKRTQKELAALEGQFQVAGLPGRLRLAQDGPVGGSSTWPNRARACQERNAPAQKERKMEDDPECRCGSEVGDDRHAGEPMEDDRSSPR